MTEEYLAHHGIKGMKWGIRRTPEQLGHKPANKRKEARQAKKEAKAAAKAKKKAESALEDREKLKAYLRKHPKQLPRYNTALTEEEANEIIKNIEFDRRLKDVRQVEVDRGRQKIRNLVGDMQTLGNLLQSGKSIYNSYVEINNALVDAGVYKDGHRKTKLGDRPEADKTLYKALYNASGDDAMKVIRNMSDKDISDYSTRVRNIQNIDRYYNPDKYEKQGKNNGMSKDDVADLIEEEFRKRNL